MVRQSASEVLRSLKKDSRFRRLNDAFNELPIYRIPIDNLLDEIEHLHKTRPVRTLNPEDGKFVDRAISACVRDQSIRSRCAEINVMCIKARSSLEKATTKLREYMLIRYSSDISMFRTKEERVIVINTAMSTFLQFIHRVSTIEACTAVIIEDIDKAAWMFKGIVSAYGLHNASEKFS